MKLVGLIGFVLAMSLAPIGFLKSTYLQILNERVKALEDFVHELNKDSEFVEDGGKELVSIRGITFRV